MSPIRDVARLGRGVEEQRERYGDVDHLPMQCRSLLGEFLRPSGDSSVSGCMDELTTTTATTTTGATHPNRTAEAEAPDEAAPCCDATRKATCCEPTAKAACCGPSGAGKSGCC